ncbi:MAG: OmpA family protein [Anaeromyxobacteraceae bacterium]
MTDMDTYDDVMNEALKMAKPSKTPWVLFVLALLAGAGASVFLLTRLDRARTDASAANAQLVDANARIEEARTTRAEVAQRLEKMEAEKSDLLALKNELSLQVQAKDEELAKLQGTYQELEQKMQEEIKTGDIRLSQSGGRIKVDLVDKILFGQGDSALTTGGGGVLSRVGAILGNVKDKKIQVSGHTDDIPISDKLKDKYPTNWDLAAARAINVVRYLEETAKIPGKNLVVAAYGPWEPISSNRTLSGRARNRRIEIVLTPAIAPVPADLEKGAAPAKKKGK